MEAAGPPLVVGHLRLSAWPDANPDHTLRDHEFARRTVARGFAPLRPRRRSRTVSGSSRARPIRTAVGPVPAQGATRGRGERDWRHDSREGGAGGRAVAEGGVGPGAGVA